MSAGLPVIGCNDCLSVSSLIQHGVNGLLSDCTADDFAQQLARLMSDYELRAQLGHEAKESMKNFSPENVWKQWETLLCSVSQKKS